MAAVLDVFGEVEETTKTQSPTKWSRNECVAGASHFFFAYELFRRISL